jgi:hypothetical protein
MGGIIAQLPVGPQVSLPGHSQAARRGTSLGELEIRAILAEGRDDAEAVARSAPYGLVRRAVCEAALADRRGYMQMFTAAAVP